MIRIAFVVGIILVESGVSTAQEKSRTERIGLPNWEVQVVRDMFGIQEVMAQVEGEYLVESNRTPITDPPPSFFVLCAFNQHDDSDINVGIGLPGTYFDVLHDNCKTGGEIFLEVASVMSHTIATVDEVNNNRPAYYNHRFFYTANPRMCGRLNWKKKKMHEFKAVHDSGWTWLINRDDHNNIVKTYNKARELNDLQTENDRAVIGVYEKHRNIKLSFNLAGLDRVYNAMFYDCDLDKTVRDVRAHFPLQK